MATGHPSDRLYRGECLNFEDAMETVVAMCDAELALNASYGEHSDPKVDEGLKAYRAAAERCLKEYREASPDDEELFYRWLQSGDEDVANIGDAASRGDYSGLAI